MFQPLDVGIQRVMKLSFKHLAHHDIVDEVCTQIDTGMTDFKVDTSLGTLRNLSLGWVVNAICDIRNEDLILKVCSVHNFGSVQSITDVHDCKAFELCHAGPFNLSHVSMTLPQALEVLCNLHKMNLALYNELSNESRQPTSVLEADDEAPFHETPNGASDIPLEVVQQHLALGPRNAGTEYVIDEYGHLSHPSVAEDADVQVEDLEVEESVTPVTEGTTESRALGCGHCIKKGTWTYGGSRWDID